MEKEVKKNSGASIRLSQAAHEVIKKFCKPRRINVGPFCEDAAIEKIKKIELSEKEKVCVNW
jgi:hypothetical protein